LQLLSKFVKSKTNGLGNLMQTVRILLVEDDQATRKVLESSLIAENYIVDTTIDRRAAINFAKQFTYDLVILDVGIPEMDDLRVCQQLRNHSYQLPILLLTTHDLTRDWILDFEVRADSYMVKPFNVLDLLAQVRALLRRGNTGINDQITWGELRLDRTLKEISYGGCLLRLTPKEYGILELLLLNPHRIFSRATFLDRLWELDEPPTESAISSHIKALRQKLKAAGATQDLIETLYGFGYRLRSLEIIASQPQPKLEVITPAELEAKSSQDLSCSELQPEISLEPRLNLPSEPPVEDTTAMMLGLWERFKDSFQEQLTLLAQVVTVFQSGQITLELQQETKQTVHKLVGSLGIFGFARGSILAKKIEKLLKTETLLSAAAIQQLATLTTALQEELKQEPVFNTSGLDTAKELPGARQAKTNSLDSLDTGVVSGNPQSWPLVLVVDDDQLLTERLQIEARTRSLRVEVAPNPKAAQLVIAQQLPEIILLDLTFTNSNEDGWSWLATLKHQYPDLPVLVFTGRDSLSDRIMAVRLGAQAFLQKPITHEEIFQIIQTTLQHIQLPTQPIVGKVMAVDDDPVILHQISLLLSNWGLQVKPLLEPSRFWEVLIETAPDLLILDIEMPDFSGIELCQVVRNDPQWEHLPILFLTAHQDTTMMVQAFTAGGNDYIRKPIVAPELIARVLHRLEMG
jgi:DNA-binding response OmpR family regulator